MENITSLNFEILDESKDAVQISRRLQDLVHRFFSKEFHSTDMHNESYLSGENELSFRPVFGLLRILSQKIVEINCGEHL